MLICEMDEKDIKLGLRVWNFNKTQQGSISQLWEDAEGLNVRIHWDSGTDSDWWAFDLKLELVEV